MLNRESPIPLYFQLVELLKEQIRLGVFQPGEQIPPERMLAEQHRISRMTVRQAIAFLVREGVLVARHGFGTFVADPKVAHDALHLRGFSEEVRRLGGIAGSQVLEQQVIVASPGIAAELQLAAGARVVRIIRLRLVDATPLVLETICVPYDLCPGLAAEDLSVQSIYTIFEQQYAIRPVRARQMVEATIANDYESSLFGIVSGVPMLLAEGVTYDELERPIEHFKAVYRGDRIRFSFESQRHADDSETLLPRVHLLAV